LLTSIASSASRCALRPCVRARARQAAAVQEEASEEDEAPEQTAPTQDAPPPCDAATRDRLASGIARFFILNEHSKKGLSRQDIRKGVMADVKDSRGKILSYVMEHAAARLRATWGYDIQLLPGRVALEGEAETRGCTQATQADDPDEKAASGGKYTLVNVAERKRAPEAQAVEDETYTALVLLVIGLIRHSSKSIEEEKLFQCLKMLGFDKEDKKAVTGGIKMRDLESIVCTRMAKEMYIMFRCAPGQPTPQPHSPGTPGAPGPCSPCARLLRRSAPHCLWLTRAPPLALATAPRLHRTQQTQNGQRVIIEGPRASKEISDERWAAFQAELGFGAGNSQTQAA
jgi:hypothetical protein